MRVETMVKPRENLKARVRRRMQGSISLVETVGNGFDGRGPTSAAFQAFVALLGRGANVTSGRRGLGMNL